MAGVRRRHRVVMVHGPGLPREDGTSDYTAHLVEALRATGMGVECVRLGPPDGTSGFTGLRALAATARTGRRIARLRPDLVHVQFAPAAYQFSGAPGWLPSLLPSEVPLVTTVHEYGWWAAPAWVPSWAWHPLERARVWDRETGRLILASTGVIATNRAHAALVRARTGVVPVEIPLAPNVATSALNPDVQAKLRARWGLAPQTVLLVFFGFVHPVKGVRYLLDALAVLRIDRPRLHLAVVGGFTSQALPASQAEAFREELARQAANSGLSDAVTFTGHLPAAEVSEVLHAADIAVLPFTEGVTLKSGALLTLLAHRLPTVVTVPDTPEPLLRDGHTVATIPRRRDTEAIVATLRTVLEDGALRRRLAAGGGEVVADRTWQRVAADHQHLYQRIVAAGHG